MNANTLLNVVVPEVVVLADESDDISIATGPQRQKSLGRSLWFLYKKKNFLDPTHRTDIKVT